MEGLWKSIKGFVQGPDPREITRKWRREIRKEKNSLNKEIRNLEIQQKKSIRDAAKRNDAKSMRILATEVVRSRRAVVRMLQNRGTLDALDLQMSEALRNYRTTKALEASGQMMKQMNKLVHIGQYQDMIKNMQREMFHAGMLSDLLQEGLDGLADTDGVEEETEERVQEVLDEICGETLAQASEATVPMSRVRVAGTEAAEEQEVDDLMRAFAAGEI